MERSDTHLGGDRVTVGNRLPSYQREMEELRKEVRALRTALRNTTPPPYRPEVEIVWSWASALTGDTTPGPRWRAPYKCKIVSVTITAGVAGSGDSEFEMYLNDVLIESFILAAGEVTHHYTFALELFQEDVLYVAGGSPQSTSCENVGVIARYRKTGQAAP